MELKTNTYENKYSFPAVLLGDSKGVEGMALMDVDTLMWSCGNGQLDREVTG